MVHAVDFVNIVYVLLFAYGCSYMHSRKMVFASCKLGDKINIIIDAISAIAIKIERGLAAMNDKIVRSYAKVSCLETTSILIDARLCEIEKSIKTSCDRIDMIDGKIDSIDSSIIVFSTNLDSLLKAMQKKNMV